jgi:DNA-binding GntR family transcriptional regulator
LPDTLPRGLAVPIAETLRERILSGQIAPGTRINEVAIARELDISRGPLREAIRYLVSEGLLVHRPNKGAVVFEADQDEVTALFELRSALETAAARLAAERRTRKDITALRRACERARTTLATGRKQVHRSDLDFHGALLEAARSPRIAEQVRRVQQQIIVVRSRHQVSPAYTAASGADHEELADAVADGKADHAAELMERHLQRVLRQMITTMAGTADA